MKETFKILKHKLYTLIGNEIWKKTIWFYTTANLEWFSFPVL